MNAETLPQTNGCNWQEKVARKRAECAAAIPPSWRLNQALFGSQSKISGPSAIIDGRSIVEQSGILSQEELEITQNYTAIELLQKLADGSVNSTFVTTAFSKRAAVSQQLLSCLTETFFDQALERARFLDEYLKRERKVLGPLHGLPISLKDSFCLKNIPSTIGYVSFLSRPSSSKNSPLVDILLDLGAVLYVKTNIPQTMMTGDSENNIFGRTLNPHNLALTAGGSSGGEGALVAFRGSVLGVGTDIAGSIRIPSLCCGTYGFKPTADRVPFGGQTSPTVEGLPGLIPCAGPMANSLADLEMFMRTVLGANPWKYDSSSIAAPWSSLPLPDAAGLGLRIGVLQEDAIFPLHPPVRRALSEAQKSLRLAGHTLIPFQPSPAASVSSGCSMAFQYFELDPEKTDLMHIIASGEPKINSIPYALPANDSEQPHPPITLADLRQLNVQRTEYCEAWHQIWVNNRLDAIIAPAAQNTAVPHDTFALPPYTVIWNVLDYPACVMPYSRVSKVLDPEPIEFALPARGPKYDPEILDGAPCAIQIVTPRFQDEKCLQIAIAIDKILKG